jgi:deazaflavin-dependent oxidoreductase (nitroreductase family)
MLAITTLGRESGKPRHTMLTCASTDGIDYVCSGWGEHSDWVKNILKNPLVMIQTYRKTYAAKAYRVTDLEEFSRVADEMFHTGGDSHFEPWLEAYGIEFNRDDMIAKRDRLFVFGFEPVIEKGPKPLPTDLRWFWPLIIALTLIIIWAIFN